MNIIYLIVSGNVYWNAYDIFVELNNYGYIKSSSLYLINN